MMEQFSLYLTAILSPFLNFLFNAGVRHFWLFACSGMIIAIIFHRMTGTGDRFLGQFFARDVWMSRSARCDYLILLCNPPLVMVMGLAFTAIPLDIAPAIAALFGDGTGNGETGRAGALLIGAGLTICLFLTDDFLRWWLHWLQHRIPFLWEFHKVHHSATTLNFATAERFHPVEIMLMSTAMAAGAGLVNGIFIGLWGDHISLMTLFGANILWVAFNLAGGILRHSPAWVSFGPRWERWFISPAMHQIHHSGNREHFDRNFGGSLAIWDRWFGTIFIPHGRLYLDYGIGPETERYQSLAALYLRPFRRAGAMLAGGIRRS